MSRPLRWTFGVIGVLIVSVGWGVILHSLSKMVPLVKAARHHAATDASTVIASRAACKPAWRRSRDALATAGKFYEDDVKAFDALLAMPDDAWTSDAGAAALGATQFGACVVDPEGAWALSLRAPGAEKKGCGDVLLELERITNDGKSMSIPVDYLKQEETDCDDRLANIPLELVFMVDLQLVEDMNQDGVPEVTLSTPGTIHGVDTTLLFTSHGGKVQRYPGTDGLSIARVSDENADGRPDLLYHYFYAAILPPQGCGTTVPGWSFSKSLLATTGSDGTLRFDDDAARDFARKVCPGPPEDPEKDVFCTLLWGYEKRAIPNYDKVQERCVAQYAKADARAEQDAKRDQDVEFPVCVDYPSRVCEEDYAGWREFAKSSLRLALWPAVHAQQVTRSEAENTALVASNDAFKRARQAMGNKDWEKAMALYREALEKTDDPDVVEGELAYAQLRSGDESGAQKTIGSFVDRIIDPSVKAASLYNLGLALDASGDKRAASRAFFRSDVLRPSKDAHQRIGKRACPADVVVDEVETLLAAWEKNAGELTQGKPDSPSAGDYHWKESANKDFTVFNAFRFPPDEKRDAVYKLDPATGRVSRCLIAAGCSCTAASPCVRAKRPHPTALHEWALFSTATQRRIAHVTWPEDADPSGKIEAKVEKNVLIVTGLGCSEKVKIAPP